MNAICHLTINNNENQNDKEPETLTSKERMSTYLLRRDNTNTIK